MDFTSDQDIGEFGLTSSTNKRWSHWISTFDGDPQSRFVKSTVPYVLTTGTKVADDWADLTDGTLDFNIDRNEFGGQLANLAFSCQGSSRPVWTGTNESGSKAFFHCLDFTSDQAGGEFGLTSSTNSRWSQCSASYCTNLAPIYCFQQ